MLSSTIYNKYNYIENPCIEQTRKLASLAVKMADIIWAVLFDSTHPIPSVHSAGC